MTKAGDPEGERRRASRAGAIDADSAASEQQVEFLLDALELRAGMRALEVGCGSGAHAVALAARGIPVTAVDVSSRLLQVAAERARAAGVGVAFFEVDPRQMPFDDEFDLVVSPGGRGFGLVADADALVLRRMMESARPGGRVVVRARNAYFVIGNQVGGEFDADSGTVAGLGRAGEDDDEQGLDRRTPVYTPRELRLLAIGVGLLPEQVWGVAAGSYARRRADTGHPELMLVARRPA